MKGLSRELLIETGLRLLDQVGLDGLSVRKLAAELGVQSPALYWHVKTKQELLEAMADVLVRGPGMGPPEGDETWPEWIGRRARAYRRSLLTHRDGARLVATVRRSPAVLADFARELEALVGLGFPPALAMHTIVTVGDYANGFVLREQAPPSMAGPAELDLIAHSPVLTEALGTGLVLDADASFDLGLEMLIAGTEALLARGQLPPRGIG